MANKAMIQQSSWIIKAFQSLFQIALTPKSHNPKKNKTNNADKKIDLCHKFEISKSLNL